MDLRRVGKYSSCFNVLHELRNEIEAMGDQNSIFMFRKVNVENCRGSGLPVNRARQLSTQSPAAQDWAGATWQGQSCPVQPSERGSSSVFFLQSSYFQGKGKRK